MQPMYSTGTLNYLDKRKPLPLECPTNLQSAQTQGTMYAVGSELSDGGFKKATKEKGSGRFHPDAEGEGHGRDLEPPESGRRR